MHNLTRFALIPALLLLASACGVTAGDNAETLDQIECIAQPQTWGPTQACGWSGSAEDGWRCDAPAVRTETTVGYDEPENSVSCRSYDVNCVPPGIEPKCAAHCTKRFVTCVPSSTLGHP